MILETLQKDMMIAMKSNAKETKAALSSLIGDIKTSAINQGCRDNITEEFVNKAILKAIKMTNEQIDSCPKDRIDLLGQYNTRLRIYKEYAPKLMSEQDIDKYIADKISSDESFATAVTNKDKRIVIKTIMSELKGKADGKLINACITKII